MKPTLEQIFEVVLRTLDVSQEKYEEVSTTREQIAVDIRQTMCYLAQRFGHSQSKIGKFLGIDHSTVCYNKRVVQDFCDTDEKYASRVMRALISIEDILKNNTETTFKGWVTRDEDGQLTLFSEKPNRDRFNKGEGFWCGNYPRELNPILFPQVTWDNEPIECELTLRLKNE